MNDDDDFRCVLTAGRWYCGHDCDDPSHGHQGLSRVLYRGRYYRPGDILPDN